MIELLRSWDKTKGSDLYVLALILVRNDIYI